MNENKLEVNNSDVMVSVIVLTYNHEKYIRQALDSILMQKVDFKYEILVGDDASTDGTPDILREYQSRYRDVFYLTLREENIGATKNAFELLLAARGRYLAFCEGDDFWLDEEKLAVQVEFLEEHSEFIGCACQCLLVNEQGNPLPKQKLSWVKYKNKFTLKDFSGGRYLPGQTASIVKKNIFQYADKDYSILYTASRFISDRTSTAVYLTQGDFSCLPRCMSAYRKITEETGANLTSRLYKCNENKCRDEMNLTKHVEKYVTDVTGEKTCFYLKRCEILADAVIEFLRKPNSVRRKILQEMAREAPWYGWLYIPYVLLRKVVLR